MGLFGKKKEQAVPEEQVADEEALRALRAASPELQELWEGDDPQQWGAGYHPDVWCDKSKMCPIVGMRFHLKGQDWDLCEGEYAKLSDTEKAAYEAISPPTIRNIKWGDGRVRVLDLRGCPLKELPAQVGLLTGLTTLDLLGCHQLTALPAELGLLTGLTTLNLMNCDRLTALPAELGLTGLTFLDLSYCPLKELPAQVGMLTGLTWLNLHGCKQLKALPAELGQLVNLTSLNLNGCGQLTLPPGAEDTASAPPTIAAYTRLLIVEPREDTPEQLHAFLLATPLAVPPFFKSILTDAAHADWLGKAVKATPDLARLPDPDGRRAIDVAVPECKHEMQAALYLLARYDVDDGPLLHRSATSAVAAAADHANPEAKPVPRVALKAMRKPEQVLAELQGRVGLSPEHVISIKAVFADEAVDAGAWKRIQKAAAELEVVAVAMAPGLSTLVQAHLFPAKRAEPGKLQKQGSLTAINTSEYSFLLVLELADRSLFQTISHEHIAGEDWAAIRHVADDLVRALAHVHSNGLIHADGKPLNAVAIGTTWKLIDFDVSCKIGQPFGTKVPSSGYCPPEFARVLLQATDDQGKVDGAKLAKYQADAAYDLWSIGTVIYQLIFGRSLWNNDVNDNVTPEDLQTLAAGGEALRKALNKALKKGEKHDSTDDLKAAAALLRKLLEPDAKTRLKFFEKHASPMLGLLSDPFFKGELIKTSDITGIPSLGEYTKDLLQAPEDRLRCVYSIDMANLKVLNEWPNLSHDKADEVLKWYAQKLMSEAEGAEKDTDLVDRAYAYHMHGDEFCVLVVAAEGAGEKDFREYTCNKLLPMISKHKYERLNYPETYFRVGALCSIDSTYEKADELQELVGKTLKRAYPDRSQPCPLNGRANYLFLSTDDEMKRVQEKMEKEILNAKFLEGRKTPSLDPATTLEVDERDVENERLKKENEELKREIAVSGEVANRINSLEAPEDGLDQLLTPADAGVRNGLTNDKYKSLASWLDEKHPGWKDNLGLKIEEQGGGALNIVPITHGPAQAQEASRTADPARVQVDERDVENERLKKKIEELKKEIVPAAVAPAAVAPAAVAPAAVAPAAVAPVAATLKGTLLKRSGLHGRFQPRHFEMVQHAAADGSLARAELRYVSKTGKTIAWGDVMAVRGVDPAGLVLVRSSGSDMHLRAADAAQRDKWVHAFPPAAASTATTGPYLTLAISTSSSLGARIGDLT